MTSSLILIVFLVYTALLFLITFITSRKASNAAFFLGNRKSPWFVVAYGMVGASLSGVTFMSVPGNVIHENFYYFPLVLGFIAGYAVVATVLLPIYYKMNLTSIYSYLETRFGISSYKSGSAFFLLSRTLGASLRMFLVVSVLHEFVFRAMGVPFWLASLIFILLIVAYTFKGGIKTIVWTDTLQTTFMLIAVFISIYFIGKEMNIGMGDLFVRVWDSPYSDLFETDVAHKRYFIKQFLSGVFITIAMTGLDQDMMQKNLSCKDLKSAQKNMFTFSGILLIINMCFLFLGAILVIYMQDIGITGLKSDHIFPTIAIQYLSPVAGLTFMIGVLSAAFSSADGAMTALTTSFSIDILSVEKKTWTEQKIKKTRYIVHACIAALFFALILLFNYFNDSSVINLVYDIASYTYGPLLGLFFVGICTKWKLKDSYVPVVVLVSPILAYLVSTIIFNLFGYAFGFELLLLNGFLCTVGLFLLKKNDLDSEIKL